MRGRARQGDRLIGTCRHPSHNSPITVGGSIVTASADVLTNSRGQARVGDQVLTDCGHSDQIVTGNATVKTNEQFTARMGDMTSGDTYEATIVTGSPNALLG
tara:strand:+ start:1415 stop:1720 length:306 start_codon:yes stop_codon:yes gene_type:complete